MDNEKVLNDIINAIKTVYDIEIPVNIFELGLIYDIDMNEENIVHIKMTLTTPNCPEAESMPIQVHDAVSVVEGVKGVNVEVVFDPPWDPSNISDEAKLELGLL
jgi:FeS assembly SUF system protein